MLDVYRQMYGSSAHPATHFLRARSSRILVSATFLVLSSSSAVLDFIFDLLFAADSPFETTKNPPPLALAASFLAFALALMASWLYADCRDVDFTGLDRSRIAFLLMPAPVMLVVVLAVLAVVVLLLELILLELVLELLLARNELAKDEMEHSQMERTLRLQCYSHLKDVLNYSKQLRPWVWTADAGSWLQ